MNIKQAKYIDPTTDFGFKHIFGNEQNKELLIAFLNSIFSGRKTITNISYNKDGIIDDIMQENIADAISDIHCSAESGEHFILEVQRFQVNFSFQRLLYYSSKIVCHQVPEKDTLIKHSQLNDQGDNIQEVYAITLMDGLQNEVFQGRQEVVKDLRLCDRETGETLFDGFGFISLNLNIFSKDYSELENELEHWLYYLKQMSTMTEEPQHLDKPIFRKLFEVAEYSKLQEDERAGYDASLKRKWDAYTKEEYNRERLGKAWEEGLEQGFIDGIVEGRKEGQQDTAFVIAQNMKELGLSINKIAEATGLTIKQIENMR